MHTIKVVFPLQPGATDRQRIVAQEICDIRKQVAKVFRTYVVVDKHTYTLTTTSKDIHLTIGLFSVDGQRHFCKLLEEEFRMSKSPEVLLTDEPSHKAMLASKTMQSDWFSVFQLAPAN